MHDAGESVQERLARISSGTSRAACRAPRGWAAPARGSIGAQPHAYIKERSDAPHPRAHLPGRRRLCWLVTPSVVESYKQSRGHNLWTQGLCGLRSGLCWPLGSSGLSSRALRLPNPCSGAAKYRERSAPRLHGRYSGYQRIAVDAHAAA